jgi:hypothetical protein
MGNNIILKLFIKISLIIIYIIFRIILHKRAKAKPPKVETEYTENGFIIKMYSPNKLLFYINSILFPIIIIIFSLCIFDIIYLLTYFKLNIIEKIISIIILFYIVTIFYIKILVKSSISKKIIFLGVIILVIGIFLVSMRFIK